LLTGTILVNLSLKRNLNLLWKLTRVVSFFPNENESRLAKKGKWCAFGTRHFTQHLLFTPTLESLDFVLDRHQIIAKYLSLAQKCCSYYKPCLLVIYTRRRKNYDKKFYSNKPWEGNHKTFYKHSYSNHYSNIFL